MKTNRFLKFQVFNYFLLIALCPVFGQQTIEKLANSSIKVEPGQFVMGSNKADDSSSDRIMKGASWGNPAKSSHSARRTINSPNSRSRGIGFRLVRFKN